MDNLSTSSSSSLKTTLVSLAVHAVCLVTAYFLSTLLFMAVFKVPAQMMLTLFGFSFLCGGLGTLAAAPLKKLSDWLISLMKL